MALSSELDMELTWKLDDNSVTKEIQELQKNQRQI